MSDRIQLIKYQTKKSDISELKSGDSQGSILQGAIILNMWSHVTKTSRTRIKGDMYFLNVKLMQNKN
jgi:hypothetical protein